MSLGPSTLSSLLAQRLDTVLGITPSDQARSGAHPDALRPVQPVVKLIKNEEHRGQPQERTDSKPGQATEHKGALAQGRQDPRLVSELQRFITNSQFTPSAPTTLGRAARTILSLLSHQASQPVQGKAPLLQARQLTEVLNLALSQNPKSTIPQSSGPSLQVEPSPQASINNAVKGPASQGQSQANQANQTSNPQPSSAPSQTAATPAAIATLARTVGVPTALVSVFIQALTQNVQQSGLFYESHLGLLVKGQVLPTQLQHQPQAQAHLSPPASTNAQGKTNSPPQQAGLTTQTVSALQQSGIEPSTQQIVRQQLDVLANQLFSWRGEAWAGVPMEWEVQRHQEQTEDEKEQDKSNGAENDQWQTRLRVDLPRLGEVEARLHLEGGSLRMHLRAPDSAEQLNVSLQKLIQRLQAQEIDIKQLQITQQDE